MSFQKIFVVGAGAIGSCYGAFLSRVHDVTLVGSLEHMRAIESRGLALGGATSGAFPMKAETSVSSVPARSLIILTTKAGDVARAAGGLRPLLKRDTVLLVLQNGLGIKDKVKAAVGDREVVRGLTMMAAELVEPGSVKCWMGVTTIEKTPAGESIQNTFEKSGLSTRLTEDILGDEWRKLVVNCVVNPLTAILGVRDSEIVTAGLRKTRHAVLAECASVAEPEGIRLGPGFAAEADRIIRSFHNYSSMHQDIARGRKTEIDHLNGKVVELGRKHRVGTPLNEALVGMIKFLEAKR